MALDAEDGGYGSRKFIITLIGMVLCLAGAILAAKWQLFGAQYSTFVSGLLGFAAIYMGGNVANSLAVGKTQAKLTAVETPAADSPSEPAESERPPQK